MKDAGLFRLKHIAGERGHRRLVVWFESVRPEPFDKLRTGYAP
jgi:hypothetical protein